MASTLRKFQPEENFTAAHYDTLIGNLNLMNCGRNYCFLTGRIPGKMSP